MEYGLFQREKNYTQGVNIFLHFFISLDLCNKILFFGLIWLSLLPPGREGKRAGTYPSKDLIFIERR